MEPISSLVKTSMGALMERHHFRWSLVATLFVLFGWNGHATSFQPTTQGSLKNSTAREVMIQQLRALPAFKQLDVESSLSGPIKIDDFVLDANEHKILPSSAKPLLVVGFLMVDDSPFITIFSTPPVPAIWNDPQGGARITVGFDSVSNSIYETDEAIFGGTTRL